MCCYQGREVHVNFAEIEEQIGIPLPPSCRRHAAHWSGYEGSAVLVRFTTRAGAPPVWTWREKPSSSSSEALNRTRPDDAVDDADGLLP